jgi:hypothetical protein
MADQIALFDAAPYTAPYTAAGIDDELSPGARRRNRQAAAVARGLHPLSAALRYGIRLHDDAGPLDDAKAPGRRCGTCRWRQTWGHHDRTYPKCTYPEGEPAEIYEVIGPPRVSHGPGTDVKARWPACVDHEYGDPRLSADAARWSPSTHEQPEH